MIINNVEVFLTATKLNFDEELFKLKTKQYKYLKRIVKSMTGDDVIITNETINSLRVELKEMNKKKWTAVIKGRQLAIEIDYDKKPSNSVLKELVDNYLNELRGFRKELNDKKYENKEVMGFKYKTLGGVFHSEKSILTLQNATNKRDRIRQSKSPIKYSKHNYVGIELELFTKLKRDQMEEIFINNGLAGKVQIKSDGSINVDIPDYYSHEVTFLCKENEIKETVKTVCSILNHENSSARVNNSCGFHLHLDIRNRNPYTSYNNLVKGLPLLNSIVPFNRVKGSSAEEYCEQNECDDLHQYYPTEESMNNPSGSRYQAINPASVGKYKSIEVRLHSGTTNPNKILKWFEICKTLADSPALDRTIETIEDFKTLNQDQDLLNYISQRQKRFNNQDLIDTKVDEVLDFLNVG